MSSSARVVASEQGVQQPAGRALLACFQRTTRRCPCLACKAYAQRITHLVRCAAALQCAWREVSATIVTWLRSHFVLECLSMHLPWPFPLLMSGTLLYFRVLAWLFACCTPLGLRRVGCLFAARGTRAGRGCGGGGFVPRSGWLCA